jgi:hypothetical protein
VPKSKVCLASAMFLTLALSACADATTTSPTTTFGDGTVAGVAPTFPNTQPTDTTPTQTTPLNPVLSTVQTTTTTTPTTSTTPSTSSSNSSSTTTDWEVVGGIFTTKAAAQSQIDKLTAAKFTGFSLKAVGAKTAAVLPGLTKADATALAAKINKAGVATATTFHLTSSSSTTGTTTTTVVGTGTNYEVVDGIFTTKIEAQAKIDKLTAANFTDFTIKPIPGEFAVVKAGLTKTEAEALVAKINATNLGPSRVKAL